MFLLFLCLIFFVFILIKRVNKKKFEKVKQEKKRWIKKRWWWWWWKKRRRSSSRRWGGGRRRVLNYAKLIKTHTPKILKQYAQISSYYTQISSCYTQIYCKYRKIVSLMLNFYITFNSNYQRWIAIFTNKNNIIHLQNYKLLTKTLIRLNHTSTTWLDSKQ